MKDLSTLSTQVRKHIIKWQIWWWWLEQSEVEENHVNVDGESRKASWRRRGDWALPVSCQSQLLLGLAD